LGRQVKASPAYTEALGALFGLIGAENVIDVTTLKPILTGTDQTTGAYKIEFVKGDTDGINLYEFDEATGQYVFVSRHSRSPFVHSRPLKDPKKPELRRYTAIYVIGDDEVGQFSDDLIATCAP
jgi:hypothetical protein